MEQSSFVGPAFSAAPLGAFRQSILVDAAISSLQANAGFREAYHSLTTGLSYLDHRYLRIDLTDARLGMMTCAVFALDNRPERDWTQDFDWINWVKAVGIPPTDANFQHNVRLQAQPVVCGTDFMQSPQRDKRKEDWLRLGVNPLTRYGYLGRFEDVDIVLAAAKTPLELVKYTQFRL